MDERRVRNGTGRNGDGTAHRVGLTRHCLASGQVRLPFALSDALPEGELLAHDVDRDETVPLVSLPPRQVSGLRSFFVAHDLQVNDLLEIRVAADGVRLACVRRARRAPRGEPAPDGDATAPTTAPTTAATSAAPAPSPARDRVVDRIGSVTVRRLGSGRFAPPAVTAPGAAAPVDEPRPGRAIPSGEAPDDEAARHPVVAGAAPTTTAHAPSADAAGPANATDGPRDPGPPRIPGSPSAPATPPAAPRATARRAAGPARNRPAGSDAPTAAGTPRRPAPAIDEGDGADADAPRVAAARPAPVARAAEAGAPDATRTDERPRSGPGAAATAASGRAGAPAPRAARPAPPVEPERDPDGAWVVESDLLDEAEARSRDRSGREAPVLGWLRRPAPERAQPAPRRPAPRPAPRQGTDVAPEAAAASPTRAAGAETRQRAREEALSRAGDLRSRIVRWLLDPVTPVIIKHERVQDEFDLAPEVARDVLGGILDDPPPSLRLTVLREDMIRVSRVTVERQA